MYLVKTPWWLKRLYPGRTWHVETKEKNLYLTFDDGPHPVATPFVLDTLKQFNAKGTFFCLGKNVLKYPEIYECILSEGHAVGNHTQTHLNGFESSSGKYLADIDKAAHIISFDLFRPPSGRLRSSQSRQLSSLYKIIMWDILTGDFDKNLTKERCLQRVLDKSGPGSILVFHDSEKALGKLRYVLPLVLEKFGKEGFSFLSL